MRKPRRESPARTRRKRVHQANMCFSLFCTVSMCEVRRGLVFQALQNLCRYLLDDTERLDSMARVVGPQACGQGNAVVLWGLESTWQTATLRVFPRQNRIVCLQFSFVFRTCPRRLSSRSLCKIQWMSSGPACHAIPWTLTVSVAWQPVNYIHLRWQTYWRTPDIGKFLLGCRRVEEKAHRCATIRVPA